MAISIEVIIGGINGELNGYIELPAFGSYHKAYEVWREKEALKLCNIYKNYFSYVPTYVSVKFPGYMYCCLYNNETKSFTIDEVKNPPY